MVQVIRDFLTVTSDLPFTIEQVRVFDKNYEFIDGHYLIMVVLLNLGILGLTQNQYKFLVFKFFYEVKCVSPKYSQCRVAVIRDFLTVTSDLPLNIEQVPNI